MRWWKGNFSERNIIHWKKRELKETTGERQHLRGSGKCWEFYHVNIVIRLYACLEKSWLHGRPGASDGLPRETWPRDDLREASPHLIFLILWYETKILSVSLGRCLGQKQGSMLSSESSREGHFALQGVLPMNLVTVNKGTSSFTMCPAEIFTLRCFFQIFYLCFHWLDVTCLSL